MLSFLRDQVLEDSLPQKPSATAGKTTTDSAKGAQEQEYLTVAAQEGRVRKGTILLVVLFSAGLLCLWFMIKKSAPQTASAETVSTEESQIEMAITRLIGVRSEMFSRMDEIVKKFYEFSDVQQVNVNELAKNPFKYEAFWGDVEKSPDAEGKGVSIDASVIRQQRIRQRAKNMQLLSIMQSDRGDCCVIDGKILYKGDSIKGFNVFQISGSFVKLESEGVEILLKLSE